MEGEEKKKATTKNHRNGEEKGRRREGEKEGEERKGVITSIPF